LSFSDAESISGQLHDAAKTKIKVLSNLFIPFAPQSDLIWAHLLGCPANGRPVWRIVKQNTI
jgi:hypothetical protein